MMMMLSRSILTLSLIALALAQCPARSLCSSSLPVPSGVNISASAGIPPSYGELVSELKTATANLSTIASRLPTNATTKPVITIYQNASMIPALWDSLAARILIVEHNSVLNVVSFLNFSRHTGPEMVAEYKAATSPSTKSSINAVFEKMKQTISGNAAADDIVLNSARLALNTFLGESPIGSVLRGLLGFQRSCANLPSLIKADNSTYINAEIDLKDCSPSNSTCISYYKAIAEKALNSLMNHQDALGFCYTQGETCQTLLNTVQPFYSITADDVGNRLEFIISNEGEVAQDIAAASLSNPLGATLFLKTATTEALDALAYAIPSVSSGCSLMCAPARPVSLVASE